MKYRYIRDDRKLIIFSVEQSKKIDFLFELITDKFCCSEEPMCFISIDGLEVTLENFLKSCNTENYRLYDNGKCCWFVHYLPSLCLLSNRWSDVKTFCEFIGSFNEGQMSISFLDPEFSVNICELNKKDELFTVVRNNSFVEILIPPDGDVLEIISGGLGFDFEEIIKWMEDRDRQSGQSGDGSLCCGRGVKVDEETNDENIFTQKFAKKKKVYEFVFCTKNKI